MNSVPDPDQKPQPHHAPRRLTKRKIALLLAAGAAVAAIAAFGATALLVNIFERKQEARNPFFRVVEITDDTTDPALWGKNFPLQYDAYRRTVDQVRTRYGGSEAVPRTPTNADPRSIVAQSRLEEDPRLKTMWAGYAFSHDFREERGHAYMLLDQELTGRQKVIQQPGACIHCHSSTYVAYKKLGDGDLLKGFDAMNKMPYQEALKQVGHPVACIDCHNPDTMQLRVTRPAFMEAIKTVKAKAGVEDFDVNRDATHQEMRSYVCAQCHVEYHFKGPDKRLTFPWDKGLKADDILAHYDEIGFRDWVHAETSAPALKAQHPEFEMWNQGTHARAGVSCSDCHMPYMRVGALKVSDHYVRSPLLNINNACQTCHKVPEEELRARVHTIQDRTFEMRGLALNALVELINEIKSARTSGVAEDRITSALDYQRKAQFLVDFVEAENSMGFHAPQEAARLLALSIDHSRHGLQALWGILKPDPAPHIPDTHRTATGPSGAGKWIIGNLPGAIDVIHSRTDVVNANTSGRQAQ